MKKIRLVVLTLTLFAAMLAWVATLKFSGGTMNIGSGLAETARGLREGVTKDLIAPSPEGPRK